MFSYPTGRKKKALSVTLASLHSKHGENLQGFIHDSGFAETLHSQYMYS